VRAKKGKVKKHQDGERSSHRKKDMSKIKCFACQQYGHYAGQCPTKKKKKGGNGMQVEVVALTKTQVDEFAKKFEEEFLLVSQHSSGTMLVGAWLIDSGATCHMTGARELFESFTESDLDLHVELGVGTKYVAGGFGTIPF
jgi:hypothetical protein